jgi:hypothetical protein
MALRDHDLFGRGREGSDENTMRKKTVDQVIGAVGLPIGERDRIGEKRGCVVDGRAAEDLVVFDIRCDSSRLPDARAFQRSCVFFVVLGRDGASIKKDSAPLRMMRRSDLLRAAKPSQVGIRLKARREIRLWSGCRNAIRLQPSPSASFRRD